MKLHHKIFLSTIIFTFLFYNEYVGLNLAILGIFLSLFVFNDTKEKNRDKTFLLLLVISIFSSFAFAWYGDFISFLAVFTSLLLLRFKSKNRNFKMLFAIPVLFVAIATFIFDFFQFEKWFPKSENSGISKKIFAFILVPFFFVAVFFGVYSLGSSHFSEIFSDYEFDFNIFSWLGIAILGFFISFIFWSLLILRCFYKRNRNLNNNFNEDQKELKPTYQFLEIDDERTSGVISLFCLNILLVIFISTYTYEQFFETIKTPNQLSAETHDGVNAVILSIVMAIMVILFYFKSGFNFDKKAKYLKILAKIWIFLNVVLIISTMMKNTDQILNLGFTYKTLGVYAFLSLSILGLFFTFLKIQHQKTNAYLFNQMFWCFFATILVCSYFNWGGFITSQNMKRKDFAENFHLISIDFNEKQMLKYAEKTKNNFIKNEIIKRAQNRKSDRLLSKALYFETIKTD